MTKQDFRQRTRRVVSQADWSQLAGPLPLLLSIQRDPIMQVQGVFELDQAEERRRRRSRDDVRPIETVVVEVEVVVVVE